MTKCSAKKIHPIHGPVSCDCDEGHSGPHGTWPDNSSMAYLWEDRLVVAPPPAPQNELEGVWISNDPRDHGRRVRVVGVQRGKVGYRNEDTARLSYAHLPNFLSMFRKEEPPMPLYTAAPPAQKEQEMRREGRSRLHGRPLDDDGKIELTVERSAAPPAPEAPTQGRTNDLQAEVARLTDQLATRTKERDKWLDLFNKSEQFQENAPWNASFMALRDERDALRKDVEGLLSVCHANQGLKDRAEKAEAALTAVQAQIAEQEKP